MKLETFTTKQGRKVKAYFRPEKNDKNVLLSIIAEDEYCFDTLKPQGLCLDIGAHIGGATLVLASMGLKVIAVEPLPENVEILKKNIAENGFDDLVTVISGVVSDKEGTETIFYSDITNVTGDVHEFIGNVYSGKVNNDANLRSVEVVATTLDAIFAQNDIRECGLVKIDCEGGEWPCFESISQDTLSKISAVVGELHMIYPGHSYESFLSLFGNGFEDVSSQYLKRGTGLHSDFVFKRIQK